MRDREQAISRAIRETLDEMLAESQARLSSPVWSTRTERAITAAVLALSDPVLEAKDREIERLRAVEETARQLALALQSGRFASDPDGAWVKVHEAADRLEEVAGWGQVEEPEPTEVHRCSEYLRLRAVEEAAQRAFGAYLTVRDQERGDEWTEVDAAMVVLREARAALVSGESTENDA